MFGVKSVVLISRGSSIAVPAGDRIELFIEAVAEGVRLDWVHLPRFTALSREHMIYPGAMIERALNLRFAELTQQGYVVADVPPIGRAAIGIPEEALAKGFEPFVVRRLESYERSKLPALDAFEQQGLVANGTDALAAHVPAFARFARERQLLVLDGNPGRWMRELVREATGTPPHRAWLRAWLDELHATPGTIETLCLRSCRLHDLDLGDHLAAFSHVAFVQTFPVNLRCVAHAKALTLGLYDPGAAIPVAALAGLGEAAKLERLAIEAARGRLAAPKFMATLAATRLPALRELAIVGESLWSVISALRGSPLLSTLRVLRVDAPISADDLQRIAGCTSELAQLERIELRFLPGSDTVADLGAIVPGLPITELGPVLPICPY